uniref:Uncharacterized protein n=1 Tax=Rheinheimera sp. BAL341 TaxID=1708203 RepID=A0A486XK97_9GAMM
MWLVLAVTAKRCQAALSIAAVPLSPLCTVYYCTGLFY